MRSRICECRSLRSRSGARYSVRVSVKQPVTCRVTIFKDMDRVVLAYPQFAVQLLPVDDRISLDSPVDYVTLVDPAYANSWNLCNPGRDLGPTYIQRKWHGFAALSESRTEGRPFEPIELRLERLQRRWNPCNSFDAVCGRNTT